MITVLGCVAAVLAVFLALPRIGEALAARRRPSGGDMLGPFDEIWHPTAHDARLSLQERREIVTPAPTPDDEEPGRIRLDGAAS